MSRVFYFLIKVVLVYKTSSISESLNALCVCGRDSNAFYRQSTCCTIVPSLNQLDLVSMSRNSLWVFLSWCCGVRFFVSIISCINHETKFCASRGLDRGVVGTDRSAVAVIWNVSRTEAVVLCSLIFTPHAYCACRLVLKILVIENADLNQAEVTDLGFWLDTNLSQEDYRLLRCVCLYLCTSDCTEFRRWFSENGFYAQRFCPFSNIPPAWCVMSHLLRQVWLWKHQPALLNVNVRRV